MLALAAVLALPAPAPAQVIELDPEFPEDVLKGAVRCAGFWFAYHAVMVARRPVAEGTDFEAYDDELGYYPAMARMFRSAALQLADGDLAKVDYMIGVEQPRQFRILSDARAEPPLPVAQAMALDEERFCNAVGMILPFPWRMH